MEKLDLEFALNTQFEETVHETVALPHYPAKLQARVILNLFIRFRRMENSEESCQGNICLSCATPHLQKVEAAILKQEPITFVLPAFPGKSPNSAKVLGHLPDMAERQALQFLNDLCRSVRRIYEPGARIIICSDGRVFSDVVGMPDANVTAYQNAIDQLILDLGLKHLSTFNLDDVEEGGNFDRLRQDLMSRYGQSLEDLQEKVRRGEDKEAQRIYCGITRFLFEDSIFPGQTQSRTSIQKSSRARAYEVIRRSNAWSELIAENFSDAVRLSIHPQSCGAQKLGIQLLGKNTWLTPWHGVAVLNQGEFTLMKRSEAEKLETRLVIDSEGRPSHYQMLEKPMKDSSNEISL